MATILRVLSFPPSSSRPEPSARSSSIASSFATLRSQPIILPSHHGFRVEGSSRKASLSSSAAKFLSAAQALTSFATQAPPTPQQRPPDTDVMGLLLRQRIIFLGFNMDEYVADAIVSQLLLLDAQDASADIRLFINSPGGATSAAMAIYDAIQLCRADVCTVAFGLAASTAAIVLAGGTKGKRFAMPNTRIMLHQPLAGASGQAIDVEIQAKEAMHHRRNVTRIYSEITGRPYENVEKDIDRDRYMSPAEAMEYGILDGVIDEDMIIPLSPLPDKVLRRGGYRDAEKEPSKFLRPVIPDTDIN